MPVKQVFKATVKRVRKRVHPIGSTYTRYFGGAQDMAKVMKGYARIYGHDIGEVAKGGGIVAAGLGQAFVVGFGLGKIAPKAMGKNPSFLREVAVGTGTTLTAVTSQATSTVVAYKGIRKAMKGVQGILEKQNEMAKFKNELRKQGIPSLMAAAKKDRLMKEAAKKVKKEQEKMSKAILPYFE